eukprot:TRINITY_DN1024_c0_g1_i1.p1 TRINITY_DN1024_c0_g1~~TRINITY_DN1024_c0_g1_i1.p1  ORF type:complete len:202 (+),score=29.21 TRINITY_DN1024_c0_g1_i1:674-1279(+)
MFSQLVQTTLESTLEEKYIDATQNYESATRAAISIANSYILSANLSSVGFDPQSKFYVAAHVGLAGRNSSVDRPSFETLFVLCEAMSDVFLGGFYLVPMPLLSCVFAPSEISRGLDQISTASIGGILTYRSSQALIVTSSPDMFHIGELIAFAWMGIISLVLVSAGLTLLYCHKKERKKFDIAEKERIDQEEHEREVDMDL